MRKHLLRAALLVSLVAWPLMAIAAVPGNVTGLFARFENGQVTVHWQPLENVETYRVYYGQKSILENDGAYDDFVTTGSKNAELILTDLPPYPKVFVGVIAVSAEGQESLSFVEEVELDLSGGSTEGHPSTSSGQGGAPSPSRKEQDATTVGLLSAVAQSPNTVQLTFSLNMQVPEDRAVEAFTVIDNTGNPLHLARIVIEGNIVTLTTETQFPGRDYAVRANDPVTSDPQIGPLLPIDPLRNAVLFTGYAGIGAVVPTEEPTSTVAATVTGQKPVAARNGLFHSGMPLLGVIVVSGAVAGWQRVRRRSGKTNVM